MTELQASTKEKIAPAIFFLGIYFMAMPLDSFSAFGIGSLTKVLILFPIIGILLERNTLFYVGGLSKILIVYLLYFSFTLIYCISYDVTFSRVLTLILNILSVLCVGALRKDYSVKEIHFLKTSLIIGSLATILCTILFSDLSAAGRLTMGVNGDTQDQNYINGYLMFAFVAFVANFFNKKVIYIIPILGIITFILFTGSRGALLAFLGTAFFITYYMLHSKGKSTGVLVLVAFVTAILYFSIDYIMAFLPQSVAIRFSSDYLETHATTGRTDIWMYLLQLYADSSVFRQIFGYGFGATSAVNHMGGALDGLPAHNLWIDHLIMGGFIGEILFSIMVFCYFKAALRTKDIFLIGIYVGFLIMMMSLSLLSYKPIWNSMMMIMIITRMQENAIRKHE